ncbi:acetyl-CoA carboxylase biotin carboxylase subunit family protein [Mesorhizobium sp. M1156]|uniref:ATP-grasp domain-containing protein n=1 Tax=Mesorhizobium sp. M1156 TaxID=2957064 RepID=UPI00333A985D
MTRRALILIEGHKLIGLLYVKAAQRLGLHPITLSSDPTQYGYLTAEGPEAVQVDTGDLDALIHECSRVRASYDIAGLTGFGSPGESVYATVGRLCRHFDLPGPNPESVERCRDKFLQRQLLADAGIPMPAYRLASDLTEVESAAAEIGLPVVVKPAAGSGSRGVRLCRTVNELAEHTTYLLDGNHIWWPSQSILVEEFAQGLQYSSYTMGNEIIGICAAVFGPLPHFVYHHFTFPALLTYDEHRRIADVSRRCLCALDLGWGPAHVEFRWTKRGPVVIEVNPRLPGGTTPRLIQLAYGVDLVTAHIKLAIGEEWDLRRTHSHTAAARFLVPDRDGMLDSFDCERAAAMPGVTEVKLYVEPATPIVRKGDCQDTVGHVIAVSACPAETGAILQRAVDLIDWSITPFPVLGQ